MQAELTRSSYINIRVEETRLDLIQTLAGDPPSNAVCAAKCSRNSQCEGFRCARKNVLFFVICCHYDVGFYLRP